MKLSYRAAEETSLESSGMAAFTCHPSVQKVEMGIVGSTPAWAIRETLVFKKQVWDQA